MLPRWIIRSLFISLVAACAAAWVGSYWRIAWVSRCANSHVKLLGVGWDSIYFSTYSQPFGSPDEWKWGIPPADREMAEREYLKNKYHSAGFAYDVYDPPVSGWIVTIPLWFPTLLSALLLYLIWRKTRPRRPGKAFPIDPAPVTRASPPAPQRPAGRT